MKAFSVVLMSLAAATQGMNLTLSNSRCTVTNSRATCTFEKETLQTRDVLYQVPEGTPPTGGWPVMIQFHGWRMGGEKDWDASSSASSGVYYKVATKAHLLNTGFAVFAPDANEFHDGGYWETNIDPYASDNLKVWETSDDHRFLTALIAEIKGGVYGNLNVDKLHAMGFSSGGFMTSRMGFNYFDEFKSISVVAGGPAWCDGWWCPETFFSSPEPKNAVEKHPPTLFLHGSRDTICRPQYATDYYNRLEAAGRATKYVTESVGHAWLSSSPGEIVNWVRQHN
eukprot:TRINITY_DN2260_c5_g1_i1.p1 TRINITY_DN2260_c5_g1~~TRINITY_DN2260_c5_g1_i1.p1  ORF type:complete len:297 (+),score=54.21 TRINITY_DN2260_c5_g1_i1:44-892(+)